MSSETTWKKSDENVDRGAHPEVLVLAEKAKYYILRVMHSEITEHLNVIRVS
jgi:hypothetical protein